MTEITGVHYILGRGVVICIDDPGPHNVGDNWLFTFTGDKCITHYAEVKGIEKSFSCQSIVGLCFGCQFDDYQLQEMRNRRFIMSKYESKPKVVDDFDELEFKDQVLTLVSYLNTPIMRRRINHEEITKMVRKLHDKLTIKGL